MLRFRRTQPLRAFAPVHASAHTHVPTERHLQNRNIGEPGNAVGKTDLAGLYASLGQCQRGADLRARIDTVTVKATPAELADLVSAAPQRPPGVAQPLGVRANLWLWRKGMQRRIARHPDALAFTRQSLTPQLDLYRRAEVDRTGKTLIVGFAGNLMRLMLPASNIPTHLDPRACDLLVLCDPARGHFVGGVPGLGTTLTELAQSLAPQAQGYARTLAFGTSAGGLAAIAVGGINGWDGAVAIGPDSPSAHPAIRSVLHDLSPGAVRTRVCYGAGRATDAEAAQEIASILGLVTLDPHPGVRQHNLLLHLMRGRRLAAAFDTWFADIPAGTVALRARKAPGPVQTRKSRRC